MAKTIFLAIYSKLSELTTRQADGGDTSLLLEKFAATPRFGDPQLNSRRWASMKIHFVVAVAIMIMSVEADASCLAAGETVQWVADYCMLKMETDDEIAVSDCIEEERKARFANDCATNLHFKKRMCELVIRNGTRAGTLDACVNDPVFKGRTVETGGVGACSGR